ncbi:uncharacterized protein T069G_11148 [Trichoderma breve]|uniref:Uncharacterized protein n=1 Tax=Trichoderma breve TaxID=2034170 RepID=A0A9W9B4K4_9HYPO|nr:uncharacterized protein T069G_11148 [Trichoderma breve]KAJ4854169.1 hypothetical protein T069G_11148 [Trichoderma breve]
MDPDAANDPIALYEAIHKRLLNNLELFAQHTNPSKLRNRGPQTMDEETAIIEAEREKNTGPEADYDISMEKLRDMRDQLGH